MNDEKIKLLAANTSLRKLNLHDTSICNKEVKSLVINTSVRILDLSQNGITNESEAVLAAGGNNKSLRSLNLSENFIKDEGVKILASNTFLKFVELTSIYGPEIIKQRENIDKSLTRIIRHNF